MTMTKASDIDKAHEVADLLRRLRKLKDRAASANADRFAYAMFDNTNVRITRDEALVILENRIRDTRDELVSINIDPDA